MIKIKKQSKENKYIIVSAGVIIRRENNVLLCLRKCVPEENKWCIPGGHIEFGETSIQAAKRELKEETGIEINNLKFYRYYDNILKDSHSVDLYFIADGFGMFLKNNEVKKINWFTLKEIENLDMAFNHKEIILDYFKNG